MKNAAKTSLAVFATCVGLGIGMAAFSVEAIAAPGPDATLPKAPTGGAVALPPSSTTGGAALPSVAAPALPAVSASPVTATPTTAQAALPAPVTATAPSPVSAMPASGIGVSGTAKDSMKNDDLSDSKIPESVRSVMRKLSSGDDKATVEDLNQAREAVAKLDLMLEIEKRLKDLTTVRAEREEKANGASLAGAIPASALGLNKKGVPPNIQAVMAQFGAAGAVGPTGMPVVAAESMVQKTEVERILGSRGRYVAILRVGEDKEKEVKVGDKLSDGRTVKAITSHGVTLVRKKKLETLKVKGVNEVFGAP